MCRKLCSGVSTEQASIGLMKQHHREMKGGQQAGSGHSLFSLFASSVRGFEEKQRK